MPPSPTISPPAVKAVDLGEALLSFARDKLVLSTKVVGASEHITMHFGPASKEMDVHKTRTAPDGAKAYETLFKIAHANLEQMMLELAGPILESLSSVARPLTLEYMERLNIGVIVGPLPTRDNLAPAMEVHSRRLTINEKKLATLYSVPKLLDELYDLEEGRIFILITHANRRKAHRVGFGFPITDRLNRRQLVWVPDKVMHEQMNRLGDLIRSAAMKFGAVGNSPPWNPEPARGT